MKHLITCAILLIFSFELSLAQSNKAAEKPFSLNESTFNAFTFRSIGPAVTSGRISDIAVNPKNINEYYVASASGGVWKTKNRGTTFVPIFDGEGSYSIGCVTLDPNNPAVVWVGTGENNNQRSVAYGDGVYKSTDGGQTWKNMGLKNSEHIANIVIDPSNSNIVYVAAYGPVWKEGGERGVYKSTDGGFNWKLVKSVSDYTGCNNLIMDPRDPKVLYAAFHQRMRKVFTYIGGGPESGLYKSIDGGETWEKLTNGLPSGDIGRIGIDISPVNPDYIYAVVEAYDEKGGIYRSTNRGAGWEKRSGTYTSGNYYQELTCDPINVDKIFITDTYYQVSTDGGKTVRNLGEINKHIDNHSIWINPADGNHMLIGCDGGIYETFDHAETYHFKENLPVTQFYKVSTDNDSPFYSVHGGTQDNLSLGGPSRTTSANGIVNADWYITSLGDGFETQVDPTNPDIIYAQAQYGALSRYDRKSGEYLFIRPIEKEGEPALRWNWDAPLLISQFNPKKLYFGANKVMMTEDQGNSWTAISPDLSRQIDRNKLEIMGKVWSIDAIAKNQSTDIFGQLTSIAESGFDEKMLWVGTDDGLIHLTTDGGKTWTKFDNLPGVPHMSYVNQIIASLHDKNTAYVCFNHHRYGDFKPYVLKTNNGGKSWTSISSDLPQRGSVYTIAEDHVDANLLFVGTEFGCYFTNNGGMNWIKTGKGLPTIAVRDMEIQRRENDLVLGTFGRGFYILDDYSPLRHINAGTESKEGEIFPVKKAWLYNEKYPLGLRDKGHLGSSYFQTPNPKPGPVFTYYLKDDLLSIKEKRQMAEKTKTEKKDKIYYPSTDSLRLEDNEWTPYLLFTISNDKGEVVRNIKRKAKKGVQQFHWDCRTAPQAPVQNRYVPAPDVLFGSEDIGYLVSQGTYYIQMQKVVNGEITSIGSKVPFQLELLPQGALQTKTFTENEKFNKEVSLLSKQLDVHKDLLSKVNSILKNAESALIDMPGLNKDFYTTIMRLKKEYQDINIIMFGDRALSRREFETPPSIAQRVGGSFVMWNSTSDVPLMYRESLGIAKKQYNEVTQKIEKLHNSTMRLATDIEQAGGPYIGR